MNWENKFFIDKVLLFLVFFNSAIMAMDDLRSKVNNYYIDPKSVILAIVGSSAGVAAFAANSFGDYNTADRFRELSCWCLFASVASGCCIDYNEQRE